MRQHRLAVLATAFITAATTLSAAPNPRPVEAPEPAAAKAGILDVIPADASAAFAIRNIDDLKRKGDKFINETNIRAGIRPSQAFDFVFQWLGIRNGIDNEAAAAIILVNLKKVGIENVTFANLDQALVVAVPFTDREKIASNFKLKAEDLPPGKIVKGTGKQRNFDLRGYLAIRGNHLLMSNNDQAIRAVLETASIRKSLAAKQQQVFNQADLLLHVGTKSWGKDWDNVLKEIEKGIDPQDDSPEARLFRELGQAVKQLQFGLVGVRFDGGLGLNVLTVFDDKEPAKQILARLAGGPGSSDLKGLPAGNVLAVQAARTDGEQTVVIARALLELALKSFVETKQFISAAHRPNFVGVFGEVWQRLTGSRVAVYQNADEQKDGLLSMIAILDTDKPAQFLAEMRELTTFINSAGLKLTNEENNRIDKQTIQQLIRDLGDNRFRVRRTATVKLRLLGEPALPYLEPATKSSDLEVAVRAKRLRKQITALAAARRKDLLGRDLLSRLNPKFAYFAKAETLAATPIDVISIRLSEGEAGHRRQLRELLGPDWSKIRIATHRRQVLVLFGSDTNLLTKALHNTKHDRAPLADIGSLREFNRRSDDGRKVQMHLSLSRSLRLITPPANPDAAPTKPTDELSSFALTVAPGRIQLDVFIPFAEAKVIAKGRGW